jgi:hypothetical protein
MLYMFLSFFQLCQRDYSGSLFGRREVSDYNDHMVCQGYCNDTHVCNLRALCVYRNHSISTGMFVCAD